ncbi:MAG: hypothetical protein ACI8S6_002769, partial [Myxococcota bacterium]
AYDDVVASGAEASLRHDAAFRRAIVLEDMGDHRASLKQIKALSSAEEWTEAESVSLELCRGIAELSSGRSRRGVERLESGLAALEGSTEQTWMRARARAARARYLLDEAAVLELKGDKKAARRLSARNALMIAAEQQVLAIVQLGETEYILVGLQEVGDAYLRLHDDLLAAPAPRKLDAAMVVIYTEAVASKAGILKRKARQYYGTGLRFAEEAGWEGGARDSLSLRLSRL